MNVACDYEAPMQMLTTEKYIAAGAVRVYNDLMVNDLGASRRLSIQDMHYYYVIDVITQACIVLGCPTQWLFR